MAEPFKRGKRILQTKGDLTDTPPLISTPLPPCRDESEPGGDGAGKGPALHARLLRAPLHPAHQVPQGQLLPALEVQDGETPLGGVRIRRVSKTIDIRDYIVSNIYGKTSNLSF